MIKKLKKGLVKRMSFNSKLVQGISAALFSAVSLASVLLLLSPGSDSSIIPITDHNATDQTEDTNKSVGGGANE